MKTIYHRPIGIMLFVLLCVPLFARAADNDFAELWDEPEETHEATSNAHEETSPVFVRARTRSGLDLVGNLVSFEDGVFVVKKSNLETASVKISELAKISFHLKKKPIEKRGGLLNQKIAFELRRLKKQGDLHNEIARLTSLVKKSRDVTEALKNCARIALAKTLMGKDPMTRNDMTALIDSIEDKKTRATVKKRIKEIMREVMSYLHGTTRGGGGGGRGSRGRQEPGERPSKGVRPR